MRKLIFAIAMMLLPVISRADQPVMASTAFTRYLLLATNANDFANRLSISLTNGGSDIPPDGLTIETNAGKIRIKNGAPFTGDNITNTTATPPSNTNAVISAAQAKSIVDTNTVPAEQSLGAPNSDARLSRNAGGVTNIATYGMENNTWVAFQKSRLEDFNNYNHFGWTRILSVLAQKQRPARILLAGTGLADLGILNGVYTNILEQYPLVGVMSPTFPYLYDGPNSGGSSGITQMSGKDGYSYVRYEISTNNAATNFYNVGITWDVFKLTYIRAPDGGTFKIQTNVNGGTWTDLSGLTGISSANAATNSVTVGWTNAAGPQAAGVVGIRAVATAAGTNRWLNCQAWDSTKNIGLIVGNWANASALIANMASTTNTAYGLFQALDPDMMVFQGIATTNDILTNMPIMANTWTSSIPNCNVVLAGTYIANAQTNTDANSLTAGNAIYRGTAVTYNFAYFDGNTPFESLTNVQNRALLGGDGVHYTATGLAAYGDFLARWLALNESPPGNSTVPGLGLRLSAQTLSVSNTLLVLEKNCTTAYSTNSLTTPFNDPELQFSVTANTRYVIRFHVFFTSADTTSGFLGRIYIPNPAPSDATLNFVEYPSNSPDPFFASCETYGNWSADGLAGTGQPGLGAGNSKFYELNAIVTFTPSVSGTAGFRWSQSTSSATALVRGKSSTISVWEISYP